MKLDKSQDTAMNMNPNDLRTKVSMSKSSGTQLENGEAWIARIQVLTMKEMTSKAHMRVHTNKESREKQSGRKPGPKRAWASRPGPAGLGRLAQPTPGPVQRPLCPRCSSIYCLFLCPPPHQTNHSTDAIHQKTATAR
jgi:hypothetical protein